MKLIHFTGKAFLGGLFLLVLSLTALFAQQDTTRNDHFWLLSDSVIIDWTNLKQPQVFREKKYSQYHLQASTSWTYKSSKGWDCIFTSYSNKRLGILDSLPTKIGTLVGEKTFTTSSLIYPNREPQMMLFNKDHHFQLYAISFIPTDQDSMYRTPIRVTGKLDSFSNIDSSGVEEFTIDGAGNKKTRLFSQGSMPSVKAVKSHDNADWWIITHSNWGNTFYSKRVSSADSVHADWSAKVGQELLAIGNLWSGGIIITNYSGNRLAVVSVNGFVEVFDYNRCTGGITPYAYYGRDSLFTTSATNNIQDRYLLGAFSPDGTKLYVGTADSIFQLDLSTDFSLKHKKLVVGLDRTNSNLPYFFLDMKLAPDNKIYISKYLNYPQSDYSLSVIAQPDSHVSKCEYQEQGLSFGQNRISEQSFLLFPNIANNSMLPQMVTDVSKIFPYPAVIICPNTPIRIGNASGIKHEWFFDTALPYVKQMEQSNYYIFQSSKPGRYTIKARVETQANPCWQDTVLWQEVTIIVRPEVQEPCLSVSRPEIEIEEPIKVYPNPASDQITVTCPQDVELYVYDAKGRLTHQLPLRPGENLLHTQTWNEGIYFFHFQTTDGSIKKTNFGKIILIR
jgi:hypothetical protein